MSEITEQITSYNKDELASRGFTVDAIPSINVDYRPFTNFVNADANIIAGVVASLVKVETADHHVGKGFAYGVGGNVDARNGTLAYTSWELLKSTKNSALIVATKDVLSIVFFVRGIPAAVFQGKGTGHAVFSTEASIQWV